MGGSIGRIVLNLSKVYRYIPRGKSEISGPGAAAVPVNAPSARLVFSFCHETIPFCLTYTTVALMSFGIVVELLISAVQNAFDSQQNIIV